MFNDLWQDEIWSLQLLDEIHSPIGILTQIYSDNNHPLNSLFLYLLKPAKAEWTYRLLSWATGTVSVGLAGIIARRQFQLLRPADAPGKAQVAGLITAIIFGGSYIFIHFSSEARGYAPAVCFSLLAFYALLHDGKGSGSGWAGLYWAACLFGLLSHLMFSNVLFAGFLWTAAQARQNFPRWLDRLVHLASWQLPPLGFFTIYYWFFIRRLTIGGSNPTSLSEALNTLAECTLGIPPELGLPLALPVLSLIILLALFLVWRRNRDLAVFYLAVVFIAPLLVTWLRSEKIMLRPRYFLINDAFAWLLAGGVLAKLWTASRLKRAGLLAILGLFLAGNAGYVRWLWRDGRGEYREAIKYIAQNTPIAEVSLTSDIEFRDEMMIQYYAPAAGAGRILHYYVNYDLPPRGPQWVILSEPDHKNSNPDAIIHDNAGHAYQLARVFPHAVLSGWDWYVFRNMDPRVFASPTKDH